MVSIFTPLLPAFVASAEGVVDEVHPPMPPEEVARIGSAVAHRRAEFHAGRALARRALASLGGPDAAIGSGDAGAPIWPGGYVGSISHTGPRVCAVAARSADARSIGIDIEEHARLHSGLERRVLTPREEAITLAGLAEVERRTALATVFSAKEAFYKMQFPLTRRRLGFQDAEVALAEDGRFELTLLAPAAPFAIGDRFRGGWRVADDLVATAVWLAA